MPKRLNPKKCVDYFRAFFCAFAILYLADPYLELPFVVYVSVYCAFLCLYQICKDMGVPAYKQSKLVAVIFSLCIILGYDWLGLLLNDYSKRRVLYTICACVGVFLFFNKSLDLLYAILLKKYTTDGRSRCATNNGKAKKVFVISFLLLWCVYFVFYLNQYPGSLSCDTRAQLAQAMGDISFENANPFINTIVLTFFVKTGLAVGGDVNLGIAQYTLFQFTMTALVFAYMVTVLYKLGINRWLIVFAQLFFNCMPYNIVYANGMWKDTFFAVLFLATMACVVECVWAMGNSNQKEATCRLGILFLLTVAASLSRNSGWSSLLVLGLLMLLYAIKNKYGEIKLIAKVLVLGTLSAVVIMSAVYPVFGVTDNGGIVTGLSVPLQQVSRVVAYDGDIPEEMLDQINKVAPVEDIKELYAPNISDPIKAIVNEEQLYENLSDYAKLWIELGRKNPKLYLDAYVDLTKGYWHLDHVSWTWDERIFENNYGVARKRLLLPEIDIAYKMAEIVDFPKCEVLYTSSIILWITIIMSGFAGVIKNKLAGICYVSIFAVYLGLMLTSPVALFRYTYCAAVCLPLIIALPFIEFKRPDFDRAVNCKEEPR